MEMLEHVITRINHMEIFSKRICLAFGRRCKNGELVNYCQNNVYLASICLNVHDDVEWMLIDVETLK